MVLSQNTDFGGFAETTDDPFMARFLKYRAKVSLMQVYNFHFLDIIDDGTVVVVIVISVLIRYKSYMMPFWL